MMYILITCCPSSYRMEIGTSNHNSKDEVVKELKKLCFSKVEISQILLGDTYADESGWVKVIEVSL